MLKKINHRMVFSAMSVMAFSALASYLEENLVIVGDGWTWRDDSVPGMAALVERMNTFAPDQEPDYYFAAGYVMAMATEAVLEQAGANGDLSRQGVLTASTQIGTLDYEGLSGEYSYDIPENRVPATASTIFRVNPELPNGVEAVAVVQSEHAAGFDL